MLRKVHTKYGDIEGLSASDPRITSFKGIPYAKPPVGNLRFHAPQKCGKWDGILKAYTFSDVPVQVKPYYDPKDLYCREWSVDKEIPMSEDCLYLNVWTPAKDKDEKLPVFVWIYGGGFQTGYSAEMEMDGERIARRGIVVVTINYRLNMFGFLCHKEITEENPAACANFGLLDQRMALEWVKENIASFGGDSNNITIGGQSAGGASVINQILYGADGLFNRAVVMSGMFLMDKNNITDPMSLEEAEQKGRDFFDFCGCSSLKEMRSLSTKQLWDKWEEYGGFEKSIQTWIPVRDDSFIKGSLTDRLQSGFTGTVPLLTGYTSDEFKTRDNTSAIKNAIFYYKKLCEKNRASCSDYVYCFDVDIPGSDNPGKFHSSDLWFWFETLAKCIRPFTGIHYDEARKMCSALSGFIKDGNPNYKDDYESLSPEWKAFDGTDKTIRTFSLR